MIGVNSWRSKDLNQVTEETDTWILKKLRKLSVDMGIMVFRNTLGVI